MKSKKNLCQEIVELKEKLQATESARRYATELRNIYVFEYEIKLIHQQQLISELTNSLDELRRLLELEREISLNYRNALKRTRS